MSNVDLKKRLYLMSLAFIFPGVPCSRNFPMSLSVRKPCCISLVLMSSVIVTLAMLPC